MRKVFRKLASLKLDRRDTTALLLSLLLALSIWFIHNLSLKYSELVSVRVEARSDIDGRASLSSGDVEIAARCRCPGFSILRLRAHSRGFKQVFFKSEDFHPYGDDLFYITSKDLMNYSQDLFGEGSSVEYFLSDTLVFRFTPVSCKKVPVILNGSFRTYDQYTIVGGVRLEPDSVTVYGDPVSLTTVDGVLTSKLKNTWLDSDRSGLLKLSKLKGLRLSDDVVKFSVAVSRYVSLSSTANIQVDNLPLGKNITLLPAVVDVRLDCTFPYGKDPLQSAIFYVDYNDFEKSLTGKCPVKLRSAPLSVLGFEADPPFVEILLQ